MPVPISRAKAVDALYEEVAGYDLVLVPDAPLASAIERRLDRAHLGPFATTPRRLAAGHRERDEERRAFHEVRTRTDHDWRDVGRAVGDVLQCWEHEGRRDAILEYDAHVDAATRATVEVLGDVETTSSRLAEYEFRSDAAGAGSIDAGSGDAESVAVVAPEQLTRLERAVVPADADRIELFTDEPVDLPDLHVFQSAASIVDAVVDTVDRESAGDVAVVLESGSNYASLVEAALAAADVPYVGGPGVADHPDVRCFRRLCRIAERGRGPTVGETAPVLAHLGVDVPAEHELRRLHAVDDPAVDWLRGFCSALTERTFAEALEAFVARVDQSPRGGDAAGPEIEAFRRELERLDLAGRPVDGDRLDVLDYYLRSYEVPTDREHEGVLLADPTSSGYVDRPVVFHVGVDDGWTHSPPRRPWVDADEEFRRHRRAFELLVQSGAEQYLLVEDARGGEPVAPCAYLSELLDDEFERFTDLDATVHSRRVGTTPSWVEAAGRTGVDDFEDHRGDGDAEEEREGWGIGFDREPVDAGDGAIDAVSNSALKRFANCPRDYCFDRLLDGPDRDFFTEGQLFHDFAEFYANHPDAVDDAALETVVDELLDAVDPFVDEHERSLRRRDYRVGVETIVEYVDEHGPDPDADFLTPASGWGTNPFAELFDRAIDSPLTERWFENASLGLKGKIDLVRAPDHLVDHKSGRRKSARQVVDRAAVDPPADRPDFQAALYLSHFRTVRPDRPLQFTFFHFLATVDDLVAGEHDLDDALTTVQYYPWTFDEHVGSRAAFEALLDGYNDCVATFEDLGFERYAEIVGGLIDVDDADGDAADAAGGNAADAADCNAAADEVRDAADATDGDAAHATDGDAADDEGGGSFPETTDREELRSSEFAAAFTDAVDAATSDDVDAETGCDQAIRLLDGIRGRTFFREDLDAVETFVAESIDRLNRHRSGVERFPIEGPGGEPNYRRVDHRDLLLEGEGR